MFLYWCFVIALFLIFGVRNCLAVLAGVLIHLVKDANGRPYGRNGRRRY